MLSKERVNFTENSPFAFLQSQMDISNDGESKQSNEDTKSNEDSGVETMEIDDKPAEVVQRKEAEKRKRTSSSANYEVTHEQVLSNLQMIFSVKLPKAAVSAPDTYLDISDTAKFMEQKTDEEENKDKQKDCNYNELISDILTEVLLKMAKGHYPPFVTKETSRDQNTLENEMTAYLIQCYARSLDEKSKVSCEKYCTQCGNSTFLREFNIIFSFSETCRCTSIK